MQEEPAAAIAAVMNAAWFARHYCRPGQGASRQAALAELARIAAEHLVRPELAEPILYAIAVGLYDRADPRFLV